MNIFEIINKARIIQDPGVRKAFLDGIVELDKASRIKIEEALSLESSDAGVTELDSRVETPCITANSDQSLTGLFSENGDTFSPKDIQSTHNDESRQSIALLRRHLEKSELGNIGRVGHFEILEIIGQGAFGIVCEAQDTKLKRKVAIKFLDPELSTKSPPRKRFLREARSAAATKQANIVSIYAVEENPIPYIVMEFVSGLNLQQQLDLEGPLEVSDVLCIAEQIAEALSAAHASGLVHRDIKPANILVETRSPLIVKLTDFGLARAVDDYSMTKSGVIAGTPLYMSPEQISGRSIDGRSDLFSCGSVLYQMLTGRPPFRATSTIAVLKRVCDDAPRPLSELQPEIPGQVCRLVNRLLEKRPEDRFQTARELLAEIKSCLKSIQPDGQPNPHMTTPNTAMNLLQKVRPSYFKPVAATAVVSVVMLSIAAIITFQRWTSKHDAKDSSTSQASLIEPVQVDYFKDTQTLEFANFEFPIFDRDTPSLSFAFTDQKALFVQPVYQVSKDHAKIGIEKWRFDPESGVRALKTRTANSLTLAYPPTSLEDGVYGVFSETSAGKPIPEFAGLFAIKGVCKPKIETVQTNSVRNVFKVKLGIRNAGAATFRKGILIAVLTADGNRFCDRQNILLPDIPPNEIHYETLDWSLASYTGIEFFCHGHINFRTHYDENSLSTFRTDSVAIDDKKNDVPKDRAK